LAPTPLLPAPGSTILTPPWTPGPSRRHPPRGLSARSPGLARNRSLEGVW